MVGVGARGNTRKEILTGLKFSEDGTDEAIGKSYNSVITALQTGGSPDTFTLLTANRVYSQAGFGISPGFVNLLKQHFQADFEQLDFSTSENCADAAARINGWVESTTNNKIKDLISKGKYLQVNWEFDRV